MFFLVLEEASFPITFPVSLVTGVSMKRIIEATHRVHTAKGNQVFSALCIHATGPANFPR